MPAQAIILFDGVCNLCNASVQFIIRHDPSAHFSFASLQSPFGQAFVSSTQRPLPDSIILIANGTYYTESGAALRIARHLSGGWPLLYGLIVIPYPLRDWGYRFIARHRYQWFGHTDQCMLPSPDLKSRFMA